MDATIFASPAIYAAGAVVILCGWAAVLLRSATDRLNEVPKLHYLREQIARKTAEYDEIKEKVEALRAGLATTIKEKAELAAIREQKRQQATELAHIEAKLDGFAEDVARMDEVEKRGAMVLDRLQHVNQEIVEAETRKASIELVVRELERQQAVHEHGIALLTAQKENVEREAARAKQKCDEAQRDTDRAKVDLHELEERHLAESAALNSIQQAVERLRGEETAARQAIDRLADQERDIVLAISTSAAERKEITAGIAILRAYSESHQRELECLRAESADRAGHGRAIAEVRRKWISFLKEEGYLADKDDAGADPASHPSPWRTLQAS